MDVSKYKKTSVGIIPKDWEVMKLGEIGTLKNGINKDKDDFGFGYPMVNLMDVFGFSKIYKDNLNLGLVNANERDLKEYALKKGDVLFIRSSVKPEGVGLTTLISDDLDLTTYSGFIIRFRDNDFLNFNFKEHCFFEEGFRRRLLNKSTISANTNINQVALNSLEISIPPISEQYKIAVILSTWDKAIDNCKEIIDNLKIRNIGLAQQLLSGKMRLKDFSKSQWHLKSVEEVAVFKNGKAHENCIDEDGDYFVVNSKFISTQGKVAKSSNQNLCPLFKNDVTLVMSDVPNGKALAKCFYIPVDDKYTLNQRICSLTAKNGTDSKFLYYQMNRNNYYLSFNNGVSQTNLKKEEVLECPLLMPDIEEQIQIVKVIDTATKELNEYEHKLEALLLQKKGLMQQLLTGKIRVNVK